MLADAAPGEGRAAGIGNVIIALGAGHAIKGQGIRNAVLGNVLLHILPAHQLGDLGKGAVAGVGQSALQVQGAVGRLAGDGLGAVFISAVAVEGPALDIRHTFQGRGGGDDLEDGAGNIADCRKRLRYTPS